MNFLAVGAATILAFALGALWYSPVLFARQWTTTHWMLDEFESRSAFCPPGSASAGDMARIVMRYLEWHSQELEDWNTILVLRAYMLRSPCS